MNLLYKHTTDSEFIWAFDIASHVFVVDSGASSVRGLHICSCLP